MLLPKSYLNSVVSIELLNETDGSYRCIATGFLAGFLSGQKDQNGDDLYKIFLVSNRHVFQGQALVFLRFNTKDGSKRYPLALKNEKGDNTWHTHSDPKVDIGVVPINIALLKADEIHCSYISEDNMAFEAVVESEQISQGDGVFVLGYPMGIAGSIKNYSIVRAGIIARMDEEIIGTEHRFIIDATIFPGNSGGPVILKPEIACLEGTKAVQKAYLLGVISAYIPYKETAYTLQGETPQPRIDFIENSGLALVVPISKVKEVVDYVSAKGEQK